MKFELMDEGQADYDWRDDPHGSVVPPVDYRGYLTYLSVTYGARNAEMLAKEFSLEIPGFIYMGMAEGNPTVREFERRVTATETAHVDEYDAYACATGNTAVHMLTEYLLAKNVRADGPTGGLRDLRDPEQWRVLSSARIYGGTFNFFNAYLPRLDMRCDFVDNPEDEQAWERAITPLTKFLFLETPTNPHGLVYDIAAVARVAHRHGLPLVVDNTVGTGALQRPLELGADIVVLSGTKGLGGHSTAGCGVVIAKKRFIKNFRAMMQGPRPVLDPRAAVDMMIGISDLSERMKRHSDNALALATTLSSHVSVGEVHYAFLPGHPHHELAKRQMSGGGPLFSFTIGRKHQSLVGEYHKRHGGKSELFVPATLEESQLFIDLLTEDGLIPLAVHIAHDRTLATHPASTSHAKVPKPTRELTGITDNLIRISIGSETPEEFAKVINQFIYTFARWAVLLARKMEKRG